MGRVEGPAWKNSSPHPKTIAPGWQLRHGLPSNPGKSDDDPGVIDAESLVGKKPVKPGLERLEVASSFQEGFDSQKVRKLNLGSAGDFVFVVQGVEQRLKS